MTRGTRIVAAGLAVVVLVGALALVFGPARGARSDIAAQRRLIATQLQTAREQLAVQRQQFALTQRQVEIASKTLHVARQTLAVARGTKHDVDLQLVISRTLLALGRELRQIGMDTRRHAANIDRKTGPPPPSP